MILTPIERAHLTEVLERFATNVSGRAETVFRRIAASGAERAAEPDATAHHRAALDLARAMGMGIVPGSPKLDFGWNGDALRDETEAYVLLHEVAHFQIALPHQRHLIAFGLGAGPEDSKPEEAERAAILFGLDREDQEALASLLGVLWEVELGQPGLASFLDQNWLEGADRPSAAAHFQNVLDRLEGMDLVDEDGRPRRHLSV